MERGGPWHNSLKEVGRLGRCNGLEIYSSPFDYLEEGGLKLHYHFQEVVLDHLKQSDVIAELGLNLAVISLDPRTREESRAWDEWIREHLRWISRNDPDFPF